VILLLLARGRDSHCNISVFDCILFVVGILLLFTIYCFKSSGAEINDDAARTFTTMFYKSFLGSSAHSITVSFNTAKMYIKKKFPYDVKDKERDKWGPEYQKFILLPMDGQHDVTLSHLLCHGNDEKKNVYCHHQVYRKDEYNTFIDRSPAAPNSSCERHSSVFVGREQLVAKVYKLLHTDANKVIMIVGESGIGKSEVCAVTSIT
jgi:hypothetical protein